MTSLEQDVTLTAKASKRIVAFDIIRGLFLLMILIDHIERYPSLFDLFTGRGRMYVSSAEGFFFLSGILIGLVYRRRLALGAKFIFKKMWTRAAELYAAGVALSFLFVGLAVWLHRTDIKDGLSPWPGWHWIITQTFLMRFSYGWADFLVRFAILMIFAPIVFWLVAKGRWRLVLLVSFIIWCFRGQNFSLSWQIIFNIGIIAGFYWYEIRRWLAHFNRHKRGLLKKSIYALSALTFAASYGSVFVLSLLNERLAGMPHWLQSFTYHWDNFNAWFWLYDQKWTMGPFRVVLFGLWFTALFLIIEKHQRKIDAMTWGVIELIGRNSLFVYSIHSVIIFGFMLIMPASTTLLYNFAITAAAMALLVAALVIYKYFTDKDSLEPLRLGFGKSLNSQT